jgi:hypothetical protein
MTLAAAVLASCTSPRNTLGTTSSPCFRALPVAAKAVHDRGVIEGVNLLSATAIAKRDPRAYDQLKAHFGRKIPGVCIVVYRGSFTATQVEEPRGRAPASGTGRFAVVVVTSPGNELLGTLVVNRLDYRTRHSRIGV